MAARPKTNRPAVACVVTALALGPATAHADTPDAERLFRYGRALMLQERFDEACPMLEESQRLDPHVGTLLNLAACHERQGKVATAWVEYQKALTAARAEGQVERARLAEGRLAALDPRVPWLRISTATPADATLAIDGSAIAPAALDSDMPLDPGRHIVTAVRDGRTLFEERVDLREGERRVVSVRPVEEGIAPPTPPPERVVVEPKTPPRATRKGSWILEPGLFVALVVGTMEETEEVYPGTVQIHAADGSGPFECTTSSCEFHTLEEGGGLTGGLNVFGGYAISEKVDVGGRVIFGPRIGPMGAAVTAVGPSLVLRPTEALSVGAWALLGEATLAGSAVVSARSGYEFRNTTRMPLSKGSAAGLGIGVELSVRLFELGGGALAANTTPFIFVGPNGSALCVPLGLAYRFQ
jgi:hypothetical protein